MQGAPWGNLLVRPVLIVAGVALVTGLVLGQCARLPDPPQEAATPISERARTEDVSPSFLACFSERNERPDVAQQYWHYRDKDASFRQDEPTRPANLPSYAEWQPAWVGHETRDGMWLESEDHWHRREAAGEAAWLAAQQTECRAFDLPALATGEKP